jgi:hypothetical protein
VFLWLVFPKRQRGISDVAVLFYKNGNIFTPWLVHSVASLSHRSKRSLLTHLFLATDMSFTFEGVGVVVTLDLSASSSVVTSQFLTQCLRRRNPVLQTPFRALITISDGDNRFTTDFPFLVVDGARNDVVLGSDWAAYCQDIADNHAEIQLPRHECCIGQCAFDPKDFPISSCCRQFVLMQITGLLLQVVLANLCTVLKLKTKSMECCLNLLCRRRSFLPMSFNWKIWFMIMVSKYVLRETI